ncbi:acyl-CoA synthetase (AMP-forming)/AMP-acid ligase II [Streptomyces sp. 1114.5]|uniref:class I adenylate-forming enzyme family protein n=1 Tax=unclassified Streptomyces TaxID=2593676 RepID=UPI000BD0772C|nr:MULTISPECIES: class I adenylate-forming enzyme family protein [unclassified Streptomyces]RKT17048.1 acyl-CoA synthetase (AMP-forming)/AMP-acid ligase II [Streptomyces sp. 1114.5]SOB83259.1 Acyl-CoA synthetase (AMP-forming)/AMP-acid ligase II [Streptomyces sp. 1331.2]
MSPETPTVLTTPDLLRHRAGVQPDGVAFIVDGGGELTYRDWDERSDAVANQLVADGVGRGDRVGLLFGGLEWTDYAVGYFGVLKAGATAVHLNADMPACELSRRLTLTSVSGLLHADGRALPAGFSGWSAAVSGLDGGPGPVKAEVEPEDIADIVFTSGTTGAAKAYTVPHGNATFGRTIGAMSAFGDSAYMLTMLQIATSSSATALNISTISQVVTVLGPLRDADRLGQLIEQYRTGIVAITPYFADRLVALRLAEKYDLSSITMFACGSSPLAPARAKKLLELVPGAAITSACSQSEANPAICINTFDPERPMSVGRPTPVTELRIVDESGEELPAGQLGEIWLRHPAPKRLYLGLAEVNARIEADGWYRTGDLGRLDEEGFLHFFDRRVDAVRTADGLVSTPAVEAALYEHPAVFEAAAFGVPAPGSPDGEVQHVAVAVVLDPDAGDVDLDAHLAGLLEPGQRPVRTVVLEKLPRNSQNKVLKRDLRELYS